MAWVVSSALQSELDEAECGPVIVARINLPLLRWLTVNNFALGTGDEVSITANSDTDTIVEGAAPPVGFNAGTSNAATAQAIANAWNADLDRVVSTQVKAIWSGGPHVAFVGLSSSISSITISTTDANAWSEVLPANPTQFEYISCIGRMPSAYVTTSDAIPVVSRISGLEWSLDPVTRETIAPRIELEFAGGQEIRELINYYNLKRAAVDLYFGTDDLASFSDYMRLPTLYVDDALPKPGAVTLKLSDALGDSWRDRKVTGAWVGWHPLQVILDVMDKAGAVAGTTYVAASLDYVTADPARSHFCLSRYHDAEFGLTASLWGDGAKAGDLITELVPLMSGTFRPSQTGPYEFVAYNYGAASVAQFSTGAITGHDVDEVEQDSLYGDHDINQVVIQFAKGGTGREREFSDSDAMSWFEMRGRLSPFKYSTDWLNGVARLNINSAVIPQYVPFGPGPDGSSSDFVIRSNQERFPIQYASRQGFCGTQTLDNFTQAPGMSLGAAAGRYVVLRFAPTVPEQCIPNSSSLEAILVSGWTLHEFIGDAVEVQAPAPGRVITSGNSYSATICQDDPDTVLPHGETIREFFNADPGGTWPANPFSGRGIQGMRTPASPAPDFWGGVISLIVGGVFRTTTYELPIEDITIQWYCAREIIRRFRFGAPRVKFKTNLSFIRVDIADFVTLENDDMVMSRLRGFGADSNVVWEVTGKKIDFFGDSPGIEWELTFVRDDALDAPAIRPALADPVIASIGTSGAAYAGNPPSGNPPTMLGWMPPVRPPRDRERRRGGGSKVFRPL